MKAKKLSKPTNEKAGVQLIPTGISGVDELLYGGIAYGNMVLIHGPPGSGKTTFGLQFIYEGASKLNENGLIISFESDPEKLLRDSMSFGWNFRKLEKEKKVRIIYTTPAILLQELNSGEGILQEEIKNINAKRVLIDGLTPLKLYSELINGRPFRDGLQLILDTLKDHKITAVLTKEVTQTRDGFTAIGIEHDQYVCDTIISLTQVTTNRHVHRYIEITKSRAQPHLLGTHTLRIETGSGIVVYRRAQSQIEASPDIKITKERVSTGIADLDKIMGGGLYKGSVTLVSGISGTGKTILSIHSVAGGIKNKEKVLFVSMDEHPNQVVREAETIGMDMRTWLNRKDLIFYYETPLELDIDVHFHTIRRLVEEHKINRVIIDSLAAYQSGNQAETNDFLFALATYFKSKQVTAILNFESPELLGVSQISKEPKASPLVDNIILLNYVEMSTRLRRAITVPKSRGSKNSRVTYEFEINEKGVSILMKESEQEIVPQEPFNSYTGLLSRSPSRVPYELTDSGEKVTKKAPRKKARASRPTRK